MASMGLSLEAAKKSLYEEMFLELNYAEVGELVSQIEQIGFPYLSLYGLDYCKEYVIGNRVRVTTSLW